MSEPLNKFQELRKWVGLSPKRRSLAFLVLMILFGFLFRLLGNPKDFLASPLKDSWFIIGFSFLSAYVIYAYETLRQQGREMPHLSSTAGFSGLSLLVKVLTALVVVVSMGILITFRIENWGGEPNFREQLTMQLVGLAVLIPIGGMYLLCGWIFSNHKYLGWSYLIFLPTFVLFVWNANYAWHNPVSLPFAGYDQLYWLVKVLPWLPLPIMIIPIIIWLFMVWPKLQEPSKLA